VTAGFTIEKLGEDALLLRLGDTIDIAVNDRVHALAACIGRQRPPWLLDIVPAFATLALCVDVDAFPATADPLAELASWLATLDSAASAHAQPMRGRCHDIPVRYGGEDGPDLEAVAAHAGLDPADVIRRHTAAQYRVGMLGFAAGFPYLLGMDSRLAMARHATPRTRVAAGSVGIGGAQTGIYPQAGPGGWQIIGRTERRLFDAAKEGPALLNPGDTLRFVAVDALGDPLP
jgi:KipI family sensor histidine kinase inhibitor